jgi:hypothetical protein
MYVCVQVFVCVQACVYVCANIYISLAFPRCLDCRLVDQYIFSASLNPVLGTH